MATMIIAAVKESIFAALCIAVYLAGFIAEGPVAT
jgi:hypothetical protein